MLYQLLLSNTLYFALTLLGAFTFFSAGLLFFDSWQVDRHKKTPLVRAVGFFLLAFVYVYYATSQDIEVITFIAQLLKISGLILISISLIGEPLLHAPKKDNQSAGKTGMALVVPFALPSLFYSLIPMSAVLMLIIAATYLRKATEGLDKQLKPAFLAFLLLGISEFLRIGFFWSGTPVVFWSKALAEFGPLWSITHFVEFLGILTLSIWVWGYVRFRLQIQLFVMIAALTIILFLFTTVLFTFLLLRNLESDTFSHLKTDVRVIQYAVERQEAEALAVATAVAENPDVKKAFSDKNLNDLYILTSKLMVSYNTNVLAVTDVTGRVIMRGEDKESVGDTLIFDPTVVNATKGHRLSTVVSLEGAIAPRIQIKASVPIREEASISGAVSTGFWVDSAFVDGVKNITGLEVSIFGNNKRAATTFIEPDGKTRFTGTLETNKNILAKVLEKGEIYVGAENIFNRPYYTAYAPLKAYPDKTIGMLFVGKLQTELFDTAQKSIRLTFLGSVILMLIFIIPAFLLSRYIKEHLEA